MSDGASHALLDRTAAVLREGYGFLPGRRRRYGTDVFEIRVLGERAICLVGADAAELLYDDDRFVRDGALPGLVQQTLVGRDGVQTLDGDAHRHRKAMFQQLTGPEHVAALADLTSARWAEATAGWPGRARVVVFDEAAEVLVRAACDWAGVPLVDRETPAAARDMVTMVDGFATAGPRHWRARLARRRREAWAADLVRRVRDGRLAAPPEAPLRVVAEHRDLDGARLAEHTAAVELLNLIRPTVAIAWYVTFAAHALHTNPRWRGRLRDGDDAALERFVQEVRRHYPFAPVVGARARQDFDWRGHHFPKGRLVLLDVYGTDHDPEYWSSPEEFDPDRFQAPTDEAYAFIPQGGGDPAGGHRCAGERVTVELAKRSVRQLVWLDYRVPEQDLRIPLHRIPTRPRSGFVIEL